MEIGGPDGVEASSRDEIGGNSKRRWTLWESMKAWWKGYKRRDDPHQR
jgi:hypothetical protein